jgi:hypothetical protein
MIYTINADEQNPVISTINLNLKSEIFFYMHYSLLAKFYLHIYVNNESLQINGISHCVNESGREIIKIVQNNNSK